MHILIVTYILSTIIMFIFIKCRGKHFEKQFLKGEISRDEYEAETLPVIYLPAILPLINTVFIIAVPFFLLIDYIMTSHVKHVDRLAEQRKIHIAHEKQKKKILAQLDKELDQKLLEAGQSVSYLNRK